jgi:hypothetical protein
VVDKVALGQVFSEYFGYSCQSSFHQLLDSHYHLSSGAGTICQSFRLSGEGKPENQDGVLLDKLRVAELVKN